jgi:hypothetical protein
LGGSGEIVSVKPSNEQQATYGEEIPIGEMNLQIEKFRLTHHTEADDAEDDMCEDDFVIGQTGTEFCQNENHTHVMKVDECKLAAQLLGGVEGDPMETKRAVGPQFGNKNFHPKHCYTRREEDNVTNEMVTKFYLNTVPDELPDDTTFFATANEAPVCTRPRHQLGKEDSSDCDKPNEYKLLQNSNLCREAAKCMGFKTHQYFVIDEMNASEHFNYPMGCFLSNKYNWTVYYNNRSYLGTAKHAKGRPICIAKTVDIDPIE